MGNQINDDLPANPLEKVVNRVGFSIQEQVTKVIQYVSIDASPVMRRKIIDCIKQVSYGATSNKPSLCIEISEWQERFIKIEYGYTGALVGANKIDWEESTNWLLTHALHQFKHQ